MLFNTIITLILVTVTVIVCIETDDSISEECSTEQRFSHTSDARNMDAPLYEQAAIECQDKGDYGNSASRYRDAAGSYKQVGNTAKAIEMYNKASESFIQARESILAIEMQSRADALQKELRVIL